jgi:hypothetical protein
MKHPPLRLQLTGELGNQIFSYSAAILASREKGQPLIIDSSVAERVFNRKPDLFDFHLMDEARITLAEISKMGIFIDKLFWKFGFTRKLTQRYQSSVLEDDQNIFSTQKVRYLRGFFQSLTNPENLLSKYQADVFTLSNPSSHLISMLDEVSRKSIIGIHVRRGDYKNYAAGFGLLTPNYYKPALGAVLENLPDSQIWLFSDEPDLVICEFVPSGIIFDRVIEEDELSPAESLVLMSRLSGLVIANSTFSWWAGFLAQKQIVAAPIPWFRSEGSWLKEENLIPKNWIRIDSDWKLAN